MATIQSLVEQRTLAIDDSQFIDLTADRYVYDSHFYSSKPALLSIAVSPIYAALRQVGITFRDQPAWAYYLTTLLSVGITSALGLGLLWYLWVDRLGMGRPWADVVAVMAGAGTLFLPYSTVFNSHTVSAVLILAGCYFTIEGAREGASKAALWAGLALSGAGALDPSLLVFLPIGFWLSLRQRRKSGLAFLAAALPIILLAAGVNLAKSGSPLPPTLNAPLRDYPGSEFREQELSGLASHENLTDLAAYAFHSVLGKRGLLTHSPILAFSLVAMVALVRSEANPPHSRELGWFGVGCLLYILLYLFQTTNYSGDAFGVRWFTSLILLLALPLGFLEGSIRSSRALRVSFFAIGALSIGLSVVGAYRPFLPLADYAAGDPGLVENSVTAALDRLVHLSSPAGKIRTLALGGSALGLFAFASIRWLRTASPGELA